MLNLIECNLGIRKLWHGVECDLEACKMAPKEVAAFYHGGKRELQLVDSRDIAQVSKKEYLGVVAQECERGRDFLLEVKNRADESRIVLGGDHMVSLVSMLADLQEYPVEDIGIIMFDSHDDFNLSEDSETGNFHGMWVRPLLTEFDFKKIDQLVPKKLKIEQILYIGNLDMEVKTAKFFREKNIRVLNEQAWQDNFELCKQEVEMFMKKFGHIHVTFDLDVVKGESDQKRSGSGNWAVNLPYENGFSVDLIKKIWENLRWPMGTSLDVVEYNDARLEGCTKTVTLARKIVKTMLE